MERGRRLRAQQPGVGLSPRMKIVIFFLYLMLTIVAIRGWMIIVRSNNVLYETGGAVATMLVLSLIVYQCNRVLVQHRQRMLAIRHANSPAPMDDAEIAAVQERLQLRRVYGENVDFFLQGGHGLSTDIIGNLLKHYTFEKATHGTDCAKLLAQQRASTAADIEQGGQVPAVGLPATVEDLSGFLVQDECAVCLCEFCDGDMLIELPCGHAYHRGCITSWLLSRNLCPMCKQQPVQLGDLTAALRGPEVVAALSAAPGTSLPIPQGAHVPTVIDAMPAVVDRLSEELQLQSQGSSTAAGLAAVIPSIGRWFRLSSIGTGTGSEGAPSPRVEERGSRVRLSSSDLEEERRSSAEELVVRFPHTTVVIPAVTPAVIAAAPAPAATPASTDLRSAAAGHRMLSISDISDLHSVGDD